MASQPIDVHIREVGPRDGLQNEPPIATDQKIELINALSRTGHQRVEAVSFVHPKAIPQMADADEVWSKVDRNPDVLYSALIPNLRGLQRAIDAGFKEVNVVLSASDTHNRANLNRPTEDSVAELDALVELAHANDVFIELVIATSFGCPFEGDTDPKRVAGIVERAEAAGIDRIAFGDTTGMGTPKRVKDLLEAVDTNLPRLMHFHNTRGTALANIMVALDYGVDQFDASVGGLGGCPYAPGASGNVATEEVVHMLHDMGYNTGIDLDKLLEVAEMAEEMVGHELPSGVYKAGPRTRLVERS
ncbi:hydroxymethylglutaryl-CoA lyase [Haloglycomyces albus]|uniref:hydroxymethylglutaryl-CoA lyase n=1 Tax=Haloglycomyces albus TaxID=526067 RepID=UPI0004A31191|nr:hydroxymethylglutaryl-CoA lyase [Haloglycomyces albus]